ncbi:hypothetical protein M407DRAFT_25939 [Tulasnella calospora MUT 4182]|uniref:Nuclear pore complex protein Nup85 n=1 Tax=Tulasnella calospora MUT 4182 TaxID=1051891 RepID=A0A0C3KT87_9AGAM|nr:hypothetical protein M407DRAFT_25939 [Tulasnella calospora MUT 4182]
MTEVPYTTIRPALLAADSFTQLSSSDFALGVTLSPRGNELAIHTQIFSERSSKTPGRSEAKPPSLSNKDAVWMAKWGSTPTSAVKLYGDSYVTFKHLQVSARQRQDEGIPFESSQNIELLHGYTEMYMENVQAYIDQLGMEENVDLDSYEHWTTVYVTLGLFQTLLTPQSGLMTGLVGEELLLWLNVNFVAPTSEQARQYAHKEKPWLEDGFWDYLTRATVRGLWKGASHFFSILSSHPSPILRRIAPQLVKTLESHPRSTSYGTEQEFFSAHSRWSDSVRLLRRELQLLNKTEGQGDWREGLEDLVGILEGKQDVIMDICSEGEGAAGWREAVAVWGIWVRPDFKRQDLPDTLALINDTLPIDGSYADEAAQAALVSQQLKRFLHNSARQNPWLGAHIADLMENMDMTVYDTPIADDDEDFQDDTNIPADALTLRDVLIMDYAEQILHADPGSWQIEFDYLAACGPVGKARLGAVLSRLAVDVEEDNSVDRSKEISVLLDTREDRMDEEGIEEEKSLARLTGMQRVQKLVEVCKDYALWEEMETLCKVVARLLIQRRRYGDAISYSIYAKDFNTVSRISDLLLEEYIVRGRDEFIELVNSVPDVSDVLLDSPTFHLGGMSSLAMTSFRNRLAFLERYAAFHKDFRDGKKKDAASGLMNMLNSDLVPKWWWGVILIDAAGLCNEDEMWFEESDAYDLLRHVEEIYIRADQGCAPDYLGALEKMMQQDMQKEDDRRSDTGDGVTVEAALKQLEVVRLALARYLARSFTMRGGR